MKTLQSIAIALWHRCVSNHQARISRYESWYGLKKH